MGYVAYTLTTGHPPFSEKKIDSSQLQDKIEQFQNVVTRATNDVGLLNLRMNSFTDGLARHENQDNKIHDDFRSDIAEVRRMVYGKKYEKEN